MAKVKIELKKPQYLMAKESEKAAKAVVKEQKISSGLSPSPFL